MTDKRLDVYLLAEPLAGSDRAALVRNLAALFKKDVPSIEKMLRKARTLVKADVDFATAAKYKAAIQKAGGQCELIDHGEEPFPLAALTPVTPRSALTVAPVEATELRPAAEPVSESSAAHNHASAYASPYATPQASSQAHDRFCYKCGKAIAQQATQCPYCFAPQRQLSAKNKVTAGLLAFFLGGLGVHRFYLGQWWGIFYLLFWFTFIPSVISVIEAIVFLASSDERWQQKYGQVPGTTAATVVLLIVGGFLFVAVIGILAAVALPAYQDYTTRSQIQASMPLVENTQQKVAAIIKEKDFYPSENILAGLPEQIGNQHIKSIQLGEGAQLVVTYKFSHLKADGNSIIWLPKKQGDQVNWSCTGGNLPDRYRAPECRGGAQAQPSTTGGASANQRIYSSDKSISLLTPASWKNDSSLNADADIGVANLRENVYAVVMRESKADFADSVSLGDYTDIMVRGLESSAKDFHLKEPLRELSINGLAAQQQTLSATVDNIKITYVVTTIDSGSHFHVIYAWTLASRYETQAALLKKVSESFTQH